MIFLYYLLIGEVVRPLIIFLAMAFSIGVGFRRYRQRGRQTDLPNSAV